MPCKSCYSTNGSVPCRRSGLSPTDRSANPLKKNILLLQVQGMMAEYERAKILERSRRGKRHGAPGRFGQRPVRHHLWLPLYRQTRRWRTLPATKFTRNTHAWCDSSLLGWVWNAARSAKFVARLQAQAIPSPKGKPYWDRTTVWGILKNPAYKGQAQFGKTQVGPRRPRLRPLRGKKAQPRRALRRRLRHGRDRPHCHRSSRLWSTRNCSRPWPNNSRRIDGVAARVVGRLLPFAARACWFAARVAMPTTGKPLSQASRKGKNRDYAYYRCVGTDAIGSAVNGCAATNSVARICWTRPVWDNACALLADPERVRREHERRRRRKKEKGGRPSEQVGKLIEKVRRGIGRLIDRRLWRGLIGENGIRATHS